MFQALLDRILQGDTFSVHSLAQEFNVSHELMEAMLADLARSGRLRLLETCDQGGCGNCGQAASCTPRGKMWVLTKRDLSS